MIPVDKLTQKIKNAIPAFTASVAFIAIILSRLGFISLSLVEGIMLFVLGLLAIDALLERKSILENIRNNTLSVLNVLSKREESRPAILWENELLNNQPLDERLNETNELFISGGSLIGLIARQGPLLRKWLEKNREKNKEAKLFLILEDPESAEYGATPVWSSEFDISRKTYAEDIRRTLKIVEPWINKFPDKIQVRLTKQVPSLTVMLFNTNKAVISLNLYLGRPEKRPVFELSEAEHPKWFNLFKERYYVELWNESKVWLPKQAGENYTE